MGFDWMGFDWMGFDLMGLGLRSELPWERSTRRGKTPGGRARSGNPGMIIDSMVSAKSIPRIPQESPIGAMGVDSRSAFRIDRIGRIDPVRDHLSSSGVTNLGESEIHGVGEGGRIRVGDGRVGAVPFQSYLGHGLECDVTAGLQERRPLALRSQITNNQCRWNRIPWRWYCYDGARARRSISGRRVSSTTVLKFIRTHRMTHSVWWQLLWFEKKRKSYW